MADGVANTSAETVQETASPRIAAMQPYLLAYLGYWSLAAAADEFILLDDVQYIKRGWVNRNSLLADGAAKRFTAEVVGASQTADFNTASFADQGRLLRQLHHAYAKAPFARTVMPLITEALNYPDRRVAPLVANSIELIGSYVGIPFRVSMSSALAVSGLRAQERILEICRRKGAKTYLNPPGGTHLYDAATFAQHEMTLRFLAMCDVEYPQFGAPFVPRLSIVDVLMFNPPERVAEYIRCHRLIAP